MKKHYDQACRDSCFATGQDHANPPKSLDEAIAQAKNKDTEPMNKAAAVMAVYACFAREFDKAIKEAA